MDKHRHIDLVHCNAPGGYTFYELNVVTGTNKPLYAAMEVLIRGLLYLFARRHLVALGSGSTQELLHAHTIHLRALAPTAFYAGVNLTGLAPSLTTGLTPYLATVPELALTMDLAFEAFPFAITHPDTPERLREALSGLVPVYVQGRQISCSHARSDSEKGASYDRTKEQGRAARADRARARALG